MVTLNTQTMKRTWYLVIGVAVIGAVVALSFINRDLLMAKFAGNEHTVDYGGGRVHFVQADKRAIFVFHERSSAGFACAEPSPDVRTAVDRAAKAVSEAQARAAKLGDVKATTSAEATQKMVMDSLMDRTQGLQVLRDMLFQACLANVRGDMSGVQYVHFVSTTLPKLTTSLIAAELVTRAEGTPNVKTGATQLSGADLQAFLTFLVLNSQ